MGIERARLGTESLNALNTAVQSTLETLTFADAQPLEAGSVPVLEAPYYITTVAVKRPYHGTIRLMISRNMAISLIGSMLGCADQVEEEWLHDGLSELVNTIGGRLLAYLVDTSSSFDLGIPQTECVTQARSAPASVLVRQAYAVNEGHIELELEFQKAQAA